MQNIEVRILQSDEIHGLKAYNFRAFKSSILTDL